MQDLSFISNMSDEDAYLFKRCVRRLLDTTFLVKDKEEKLNLDNWHIHPHVSLILIKIIIKQNYNYLLIMKNMI